MTLTVKERARHVATFRFVEVRLMETLAAWVPSTPEMEAKLLFGPHIWECAESADALGRHGHELRLPLQHSLPPSARYLRLLDELAAVSGASARIAALYDGLLPGFMGRLRAYLEATDALMDAPSVRVVERILQAHERMLGDAAAVRAQCPDLAVPERGVAERWMDRECTADLLAADGGADLSRQAA
jgi:hypothetical protein